MSQTGPRAEFVALRKYVKELERQFLSQHLGPSVATLAPPNRRELLDSAAFIVLAHGALENFVEGIALWRLEKTVNTWVSFKRASRHTAALLLHQPSPEIDSTTVYDRIRTSLADAKRAHSKVVADNHGIALKDLHKLLAPLGVDVPKDPTLTASLESVVSMRHDWAHKYRFGARVVKSARDAKTAADDCVLLAERIATEIIKA